MSDARLGGARARRAVLEWAAKLFLIVLLYFLAAAASYGGFYDKWGLRDDRPTFSAMAILDGTAARPFVYRQLLPQIATALSEAMPESLKDKLVALSLEPGDAVTGRTRLGLLPGPANGAGDMPRYYMLYLSSFAFCFLALFLMRWFALDSGMSPLSATLAPVLFSLILPVIVSFFYDFSEMVFLFAALCCARPGRRWLLLPISALAVWNKESYLFFILALSVLYIRSPRDIAGMATIGLSLLIAGTIYLYERYLYRENIGSDVYYQLRDNIAFYLDPASLFRKDIVYGLPSLANYSVVTMAAILALVVLGWRRLPPVMKTFTFACLAISLPLLALFTYPGSMRNLSFLYPSVLLLIAATLDRLKDPVELRAS